MAAVRLGRGIGFLSWWGAEGSMEGQSPWRQSTLARKFDLLFGEQMVGLGAGEQRAGQAVNRREPESFQRGDSGTVNSPGLSTSDFSEHSEFPHIVCEMIVEREQEICLRSLPCECGR